MGYGRIMDNAHWASDCLWGIYFAFIYAYLFYFFLFRVSEQNQLFSLPATLEGSHPISEKKAWELGILFSFLFVQIGILLFLLGIKEFLVFCLGMQGDLSRFNHFNK